VPAVSSVENKSHFMATDAYVYLDKTYDCLIYVITLECKWRIELYFDDGGMRGAVSGQWYLELKDLTGSYYTKPIDLHILNQKGRFVLSALNEITRRWDAWHKLNP